MSEKRVTIVDIADELGVSTATVSNVIHGKTKKVSPRTVRRVQELLEERRYIPSMAGILLAILACEFFWSLGENVYAVIYGHIGTESCAAMTLTTPMQVLFMGMLSGLAQAAGILTGKTLGREEYDRAFQESLKLMKYGLVASGVLSVLLILCSRYYVEMYGVSRQVKELAWQIMEAFALIAPVKVQNMILGGGILRSGGKTGYVMTVDFVGTWLFGVPLGVVAAFVWNLSIPWVYFILSLEEWVRFLISVLIFRKGKWMGSLPKIS